MSGLSTEGRIILTGLSGSRSYGTNTDESDYDYISICSTGPGGYYGLNEFGSSGTKEESKDNIVEHKYYEIKKIMKLFYRFNPNVITLLWNDPVFYWNMTEAGWHLLFNKTIFNSRLIYKTFSGFAHSQLKKMGGIFNDTQKENEDLKYGYDQLFSEMDYILEKQRKLRIVDSQIPNGSDFIWSNGYLNAYIEVVKHIKEESSKINLGPVTGRMGAKRKELIDKYGMDTKCLSHTIRLMRMCNEFLEHPENGLKVNRTNIDAQELLDIRNGKLTQEQGKQMSDELLEKAKELVIKSHLPETPDWNKVNNLTVDLIMSDLNVR